MIFAFEGTDFVLNLQFKRSEIMKKSMAFLFATMLAVAVTSCAVEKEENTSYYFEQELYSWVKVNYPDRISQKTSDGAYILEYTQGSGAPVADTSYVGVHYYKTDLYGNIASTNLQDLAERLGTFSNAKYYGTDIWKIGQNSVYHSIEEVLKKMKVGGHVKLAIPVGASTVEYQVYNPFVTAEEANIIFDITLDEVRGDVFKAQKEALKEYSKRYSQIDTCSDNFYLKKLKRSTSEKDSIQNGQEIKVFYIAKLLDGHVFDTNIADSAKKYRIFNASNDYDALTITYYDNLSDISTKNSYVDGFLTAIIKMRKTEEADAFFWSTLGYDAAGSDEVVPEYSPLSFYIKIQGDTK